MKLAPVLAEYLYQNKRLDLPGIGTFLFTPTTFTGDDNNKQSSIKFEADHLVSESPELINFISTKTGKMKALAAADLDSHLELAQQFINIGNPFLFEGIGSLVKTKSGQYEFSPEIIANEKTKEFKGKEITSTSSTENSFTDYNNILSPKKIKTNWQKPVILLLILIGVGLAIWGGYTLSKKRVSKNNTVSVPQKTEEEISQPDTTTIAKKVDSIVVEKPRVSSGNYKFVVEVAAKERGLHRYDMLKGFGLDVQMETKDSVDFKLFFLLPAAAKDTARIIDSLRYLYTPYWGKAFVEN